MTAVVLQARIDSARLRGRALRGGALFVLLLFLTGPGLPLAAQSPGPAPSSPPRLFSLEEVLGTLGPAAEFRWDPLFRSGAFTAGGRRFTFAAALPGESGPVLMDSRELFTLPLPYIEQGVLRFPEPFVNTLRENMGKIPGDDPSRFRIAAIIVDPGHGGKDAGATGTHILDGKTVKLAEKDITLRVSRDLHARLGSAYPDKQVLLTRTGDTFPSLEDRVALANSVPLRDNEAIVFISVHANASFNKNARGYEVWYLSPEYRRTVIDTEKFDDSADIMTIRNAMLEEEFTTESIIMAQSILRGFDDYLGRLMPSRGIKAEEWFVVRNARMPSVLVELGFVTNEDDARLMNDETHLRKFSDALYKGIIDFITLFERSGGFTAIR